MSRHELPAEYAEGTAVIIINAYGPMLEGTITKRTKTQITTTSASGRVQRWVAGWGTRTNGELQPHGTLSDPYSPAQRDRLMLADSPNVTRERNRRIEKKRAEDLRVALNNAERHGRVEDLEALLAILPERIEKAKAKQAAADAAEAERQAVLAASAERWANRGQRVNA